MSVGALGQSEVEEKLKWRQDTDVDGEKATMTAKLSSPTSAATMLSRNCVRYNQNQQTTGKSPPPPPSNVPGVLSASDTARRKGPIRNYYVVLEKSPPRISSDESDTSTYDKSFHCRETDICQDSTDYESSSGGDDSFTTEGIATVDIVEYEVASASDDDVNSVNNSSSGTDDHGLVMAAVTALDTTSSSSDFADSEESDSDKLFDKELTEADYWECIRCKNPHNNPLYRMCEKCYKIRRTHFPPRPKFRRKRLNRRRKVATPNEVDTGKLASSNQSLQLPREMEDISKRLRDDVTGNDGYKASMKNGCNSFKKRKLSYSNNKSQLNSAAETSDEEELLSDIDHRSKNKKIVGAGHRKRKSPLARCNRETISTNLSSSGQSSLSSNRLEASLSRKRKSSSANDLEIRNAKLPRVPDFKIISTMETASDTDNDLAFVADMARTQKDSGISSAQSSQEPASSSLSDERSVEKDEYVQQCSEETLHTKASDLTENVAVIENPVIDLSLENRIGEMKHSNLIRSISDCSSTLLNNNLSAEAFTMNVNNLDSNFSSYGSCIICLSGPKNGVFVHSKFLHLCSCYKCAVKIWSKYKRCPVCNSSVKNVLKLFVH